MERRYHAGDQLNESLALIIALQLLSGPLRAPQRVGGVKQVFMDFPGELPVHGVAPLIDAKYPAEAGGDRPPIFRISKST
jgi:hypothetical protein